MSKKQMPKRLVIMSEEEVFTHGSPYLKGLLCFGEMSQDDKDRCDLGDLWLDCDHMKTGKNQGRGYIEFVRIDVCKSITYAIYRGDCGDLAGEELELLERFNRPEFEDWFYKAPDISGWDSWDEFSGKGVAFRGGQGYCYALWVYNRDAVAVQVDVKEAQHHLHHVIFQELQEHPGYFGGDYWSGNDKFDVNLWSLQPDESDSEKWEILAAAYPVLDTPSGPTTDTSVEPLWLDPSRFLWLRATDDNTYGNNLRKD